jgi:MoaA/NifB/PqqE/SkfB family radical SAM enzyme
MENTDRAASGVTIEISGVCNANCPYCAQRRLRREKHRGGYISAAFFGRVLDHLIDAGCIQWNVNPQVSLFNWGEPLLNPQINDILNCMKTRRLTAAISSNFIKAPIIEPRHLSTIGTVVISLSGFSQESYGRIHGASLDEVIGNFEAFYKQLREHSDQTSIVVSWHRYVFNEHEMWDAFRYFDRPGVTFNPVVAYFNDAIEFIDFAKGRLSEERLKLARNDIHLESLTNSLHRHSKISGKFSCPAWDSLVIDETGQLLLCCGVTSRDSNYVLGNILDMSSEEIWNAKSKCRGLCGECIKSGIAPLAYNPFMLFDKTLPPGGGLHRIKLLSRYYWYYRDQAKRMVSKLPGGTRFIRELGHMKRKMSSSSRRVA